MPESFEKEGITKENMLFSDGYLIKNFTELRKLIVELSCLNSEYILFFRGPHTDYKRGYGKKGEAFRGPYSGFSFLRRSDTICLVLLTSSRILVILDGRSLKVTAPFLIRVLFNHFLRIFYS